MSDHEFEKQVRQKLTNLKLTPTPQAWENIEEKMRERRRRTPFLWLPLLLAGMIAGGYVVLNTGTSRPLTAAKESGNLLPEKTPAGKEIIPGEHKLQPSPLHDQPEEKQLQNLQAGKQAAQGAALKNKSNNITIAHDEHLLSVKHTSKRKTVAHYRDEKDNDVAANELSSSAVQNVEHNDPGSKKISDARESSAGNERDMNGTNDDHNKNIISEEQQVKDSIKEQPKKSIALPKPAADEKPAVAKITTPASKVPDSKWSYALNLFTGISAVNEGGLFGVNKPKVEDIAYTTNFAATVVNYAPVYKPSTISPGFTFSGGAEVKRQLSKIFSVSAGLNYTQLNTRTQVGDRINSSNVVNNGVRGYLYVQSYYLLDQNEAKEYKNRYHFIELPVTLHTRITRSEAFPVYWDAGFVVSRLITSTSLHFDGTTGVYYKNDRLLNQTQAGVTTGFSFALFNKTKHPLWIGPSVRSNINSILKKDISDNKHFVTLGLDMKFFLKK